MTLLSTKAVAKFFAYSVCIYSKKFDTIKP